MIVATRRGILTGLGSLLLAPAVVSAASLMPISARKLPKLKYVRAIAPDAGVIEELAGTAPVWMIPCDGRIVSGRDYPDLYEAVRGPLHLIGTGHRHEWLHIQHEEGHVPSAKDDVEIWRSRLNTKQADTADLQDCWYQYRDLKELTT